MTRGHRLHVLANALAVDEFLTDEFGGTNFALAQIEQVSEDVREKAETFEEREAMLRERFANTAD